MIQQRQGNFKDKGDNKLKLVFKMELIIYGRLSPCSKRAIRRVRKKWGHSYQYTPRQILINRLCAELNWSEEQVRNQIIKEREFITKYRQYLR